MALLFPGNDAECPMFCRNVDSFLFRQISGSRFVHFLAKVMPKFFVNGAEGTIVPQPADPPERLQGFRGQCQTGPREFASSNTSGV